MTLRHGLLGAYVLGLGASITLSQLALAVLSLAWLWRLVSPAGRRRVPLPLLGPILTFSGASILSALASGDPVASLVAGKGLLLAMGLYVTVDALADEREAGRLLTALVVVGAVGAVVGLVQVATCPGLVPGATPEARPYRCNRGRGFFSIYMTQAGVLNLLLLASAPRLLPGARRRAAAAVPWVVMVLGLVVTYVRGAWLGFAAGILALTVLARRGRWLLLGALGVLVVLALSGPEELRQRVRSMADPQEATIKERLYMWRSGAEMLQERPLLGTGPGGVRRQYERYALPEAIKKRTSHLHNSPLHILVERGLIGLAAWLWIWVAFYVRAGGILLRLDPGRREARALVAGSLAAVTAFLVAGLSEHTFGDSEVVLLAWTLMALPFVVGAHGTPDRPAGTGPAP